MRTERPENINVFFGPDKGSQRRVAVRAVVVDLALTLCTADIGFLVLEEPGLDVRVPIYRAPIRTGDAIKVSGWGYTSDTHNALPTRRSTLDALPVKLVGPGFIPAGTFSVAGNSLCYGDSGSAAILDGAVAGVYSRIEPEPVVCSDELMRNVFTTIAPNTGLVARAYAAIGEEPWYAGERPPWLAPDGDACTEDDACRSGVCDGAAGTCAPSCGDTGLACTGGLACVEATCADAPAEAGEADEAAPPEPDTSGCAVAQGKRRHVLTAAFLSIAGIALVHRRRRRPPARRVLGAPET